MAAKSAKSAASSKAASARGARSAVSEPPPAAPPKVSRTKRPGKFPGSSPFPNQPKLTEEMRVFVVTMLARYEGVREIARMVKDVYGVSITPQAVDLYNPETSNGSELSEHLRVIYDRERADQGVRMRRYGMTTQEKRMAIIEHATERALRAGNDVMAVKYCEQAAKEVGGMFTNKKEISGPNGGPVSIDVSNTSIESLTARLEAILSRGGNEPGAPKP